MLELDAAGTVLYFRTEQNAESADAPPDITGRNFYYDVAPFLNVEEFHEYLDDFNTSDEHANSFKFNCKYDNEIVPVRVLLARLCERTGQQMRKSTLVHIREQRPPH